MTPPRQSDSDFLKRVRGEITATEYVRRLDASIQAREDRCWCGKHRREHVNGQMCTRWLP